MGRLVNELRGSVGGIGPSCNGDRLSLDGLEMRVSQSASGVEPLLDRRFRRHRLPTVLCNAVQFAIANVDQFGNLSKHARDIFPNEAVNERPVDHLTRFDRGGDHPLGTQHLDEFFFHPRIS